MRIHLDIFTPALFLQLLMGFLLVSSILSQEEISSDDSDLDLLLWRYHNMHFDKRAPSLAGAKKVCGKQLRSLFSLVCQGRYASKHTANIEAAANREAPSARKRNRQQDVVTQDEDLLRTATGDDDLRNDDHFHATETSFFVERRSEPAQGGAYSTCCLKACTLTEIVAYCHPEIQKNVYGMLLARLRSQSALAPST